MKISLLQTDIVWSDPKANCEHIDSLVASMPQSDVYVLPEMFSTGFATNPEGVAERDEFTLSWMKSFASKHDAAICGSVAVQTDDGYRNRFYFVEPDGKVTFYDKRHLFSYGGEHKRYTRGEKRVVVEFRGVRILLQVCYDLRFPVFSRNHKDYDAIFYVANWPVPRLEVWKTLLHARALENQCYVVGVNRCGTDPACEYSGGTMLIDAYGRNVAECAYGKEDSLTADLDLAKLASFRAKFPVLDDAD